MYTCNDCGEEFEVPAREQAGAGRDEEYDAVCPVCGSDDIEFDNDDEDEDDIGDLDDLDDWDDNDDADLDLGDEEDEA